MLPLWIIDITKKSVRRDEFLRLVGQIENVFIQKDVCQQTESDENDSQTISDTDAGATMAVNTVVASFHDEMSENEQGLDVATKRSLEEVIAEEEKEEAARNAVLLGNYWYYSSYNIENYFKDTDTQASLIDAAQKESPESNVLLNEVAKGMYAFQEALVASAKCYIAELRKSNAKPYQPFHVVVLGDATEAFTQLVYASIAVVLQKEKGRFLPGHIHQGISIVGMLYVPCDINAYHVDDRLKVLKLLKEIDVQHKITAIRGYDRMIIYQNVQSRTECSYPMLDAKKQAEYLLQCLVNVYLACDINHPIFQGTGSSDAFYVSMGATSVYFDMSVEDESDASKVAQKLLCNFKETSDQVSPNKIKLFDDDIVKNCEAQKLIHDFKIAKIDLETVSDDIPRPHPITDYGHRNLKRLYYGQYLKFFPAELLKTVMVQIEQQTSQKLDEISAYCGRVYTAAKQAIFPSIKRVISRVNEHDGALSFIEDEIQDMQYFLSNQKKEVHSAIDRVYWYTIMYDEESRIIPKNQLDHFEEYHDAYLNDVKSKNGGAGCQNMRNEVITNLKKHLSKENTLLATLIGSLLLGIMCVLGLLPLLDFISPALINLGDIKENAFYWAAAVFMLPFIGQLISCLLYVRKRNRYVRILKAYYYHDAYARIANRIDFEANAFYTKMINLLEEYLVRCKKVREEVQIVDPNPGVKMMIPRSMFNQPLNGGKFADQQLIPESEIERCQIRVNYVPRMIETLTRSHYYMLINSFKDEFMLLFQGVDVVDNHARRFDEQKGDYVFVSKETIEQERLQEWEKNKEAFKTLLVESVQKNILPRQYSTIGDKLMQYKKKIEKVNLLESVIAYTAANGEVCADVNTEYADVKINRDIEELLTNYLPIYNTRIQVSKTDEVYQKYLFITRWRCTDKLALNRLLPKEDFDQDAKDILIYDHEIKAREKKKKNEKRFKNISEVEDAPVSVANDVYSRCISSIILWSVCPDDNSKEWLNLFNVENFSNAYDDRNQVRAVMNQND